MPSLRPRSASKPVRTKPGHAAKPARMSVRQLAALLRRPPESTLTYQGYNYLRQLYILAQAARHFDARPDDPVPLYGRQLLDAGCGRSTISQFLALSGADITAIDPNATQLAEAEASAQSFGAPITFLNNKVESLLNTGQTFDMILALDLLESTDNPEKMLWVLRQLLKPGGLLVVSAINQTPWAWVLHILLSIRVYKRTPQGERAWQRFYRPRHLSEMASRQGLTAGHLQQLHFNLLTQTWQVHASRGTRYLMALTHAGAHAVR